MAPPTGVSCVCFFGECEAWPSEPGADDAGDDVAEAEGEGEGDAAVAAATSPSSSNRSFPCARSSREPPAPGATARVAVAPGAEEPLVARWSPMWAAACDTAFCRQPV